MFLKAMAIADLQPRQGNVNLVATIVSKENAREFNKFGKPGRVCNAVIKDDSGEMKLTLWNEQVELVSIGDKIEVKNGYVSEWQGERQLSTGKFGTLSILGKTDAAADAANPEQPQKPATVYTNAPRKSPSAEDEAPEEEIEYDEDA